MKKLPIYVDLSWLRNPYLIPREPAQKRNGDSPSDNEQHLLTLFVLRCMTIGVWSLPMREARKIFRKSPDDTHGADETIRRFVRMGLLSHRRSRLDADRSLRRTIFLTLQEMALKKNIRSYPISVKARNQLLVERSIINIFDNFYCCPAEAEIAFYTYCPYWKSFSDHKKAVQSVFRELRLINAP